MTDFSPADMAPFFATLAEAAAAQTLPRFRQGIAISNKLDDDFDPVTDADRMSEKAIRELILKKFPDHSILGEEWGVTEGDAPWRWVIDPVDGTRAFICGVPVWTTLIGLEKHNKLVAGMIDQPFTDERWIGVQGRGAVYTRAGQTESVRVSTCNALSDARLMVTDTRGRGGYFTQDEARKVEALSLSCKVTRQGLDGYGFGLLAMGQIDLVIEAGLSWYDVAAVIPVIEAAGGIAMKWDGSPVTDPMGRGDVIMAASQDLAEAAAAALR